MGTKRICQNLDMLFLSSFRPVQSPEIGKNAFFAPLKAIYDLCMGDRAKMPDTKMS